MDIFQKLVKEYYEDGEGLEWLDEDRGLALIEYDSLAELVQEAGLRALFDKEMRAAVQALIPADIEYFVEQEKE